MHECYRKGLYSRTYRNYDRESLRECLEYIVMSDGLRVEHISSQDRSLAASAAKVNHGDRCTADALTCMLLPVAPEVDSLGVQLLQEAEYPIGSFAREIMDYHRKENEHAYG